MKPIIVSGIIAVLVLGSGFWVYRYLNPEDVVVDEELPIFLEDNASQEVDSPDEFQISQPADGVVPEVARLQTESSFQQGDSTYTIEGDAVVSQVGDERSLSFLDFSVTAGPDLFVYLVQTDDTSNEGVKAAVEVGDFVNIATLKGNIGNQGYEVPLDVDLDDYTVISIWCRQFGRNFGHAVIN